MPTQPALLLPEIECTVPFIVHEDVGIASIEIGPFKAPLSVLVNHNLGRTAGNICLTPRPITKVLWLIGRLFDPDIVLAIRAAPIMPVLRSRLVWRGSRAFEIHVAEELQQEATLLAKSFIVACAERWRATHVVAECLVSRFPPDNNCLRLHWRSRRRVR